MIFKLQVKGGKSTSVYSYDYLVLEVGHAFMCECPWENVPKGENYFKFPSNVLV